MRRAAKVDANHGEIVAALRAHGCKVVDLSGVGKGLPDVLVWIPAWSRWALLEIKVPGEKLNERQQKWHRDFAGCLAFVVTSPAEAIAAIEHFEG